MSKTLVTEIVIAAPAMAVWDVLTDFTRYAEWNPFIVEAAGEASVGSKLTLRMQPVGGRAITLRPTVLEAVAGEKLRWRGRLGVGGLFDAEHSFLLEERSTGTRLVQCEVFSGGLVPLLGRSLDRRTLPAFHLMNEALEQRAAWDAVAHQRD
jgi:hypothetical protein